MKYKAGDKVRIRSKEWYNEYKDKHGEVRGAFFDKERAKLCGSIQTIASGTILDSGIIIYAIETDYEFIGEEAIEGLVEEETKPTLSKNAKLVSERFAEDVNVSEFKPHQNEIMKLLLQGALNIPEGYIFKDENGNVINATKIVLEKKKKEYPKTYKECCDVLGLNTMDNDAQGYKWELIIRFQELLIARDAYWKIAGEELGLGKPWEPDWTNNNEVKFIIGVSENEIIKCYNGIAQYILAFPTEEMRDAFYDNFKELIESCKELL